MSLTNEQLSSMTLAEIEILAARFATAVGVIREAQALMGGTPTVLTAAPPVHYSPPAVSLQPPMPPNSVVFTPAELALRAKLKAQREEVVEGEE